MIALLGLGSNIGDREANCRKALSELAQKGIAIRKVSSAYETKPWGVEDQPCFINMAAEIETSLSPRELLNLLKETETGLGRTETFRWGPRVIDIDILLCNGLVLRDADFAVPHPYLHERLFVLDPLFEIAPEAVHPVFGKSVGEMREELRKKTQG